VAAPAFVMRAIPYMPSPSRGLVGPGLCLSLRLLAMRRERGASGVPRKCSFSAPLRRPARRFMASDFHSPAWSALRPGFRPASYAPPLRPSRLAADRSSRSGGRIGTPEARPAGTGRISPRAPPTLPVKLRSTRTLSEGRWRECKRGSGGGDYFPRWRTVNGVPSGGLHDAQNRMEAWQLPPTAR
jgi:hypothetical protein